MAPSRDICHPDDLTPQARATCGRLCQPARAVGALVEGGIEEQDVRNNTARIKVAIDMVDFMKRNIAGEGG